MGLEGFGGIERGGGLGVRVGVSKRLKVLKVSNSRLQGIRFSVFRGALGCGMLEADDIRVQGVQ